MTYRVLHHVLSASMHFTMPMQLWAGRLNLRASGVKCKAIEFTTDCRNSEIAELRVFYGRIEQSTSNLEERLRGLTFIGAAERGRLDIVKGMLCSDPNLLDKTNSRGHNALRGASENGHIEVVNLLLELGANVNAGSMFKWTALHVAARAGHVEICQLLIEAGADINAANSDNRTPLFMAVLGGKVETLDLLLANGADANASDLHGWTPLYVAVANNAEALVNPLLKAGAMTEARAIYAYTTSSGLSLAHHTALHFAASRGNVKMVSLLVEAGASTVACDLNGKTPVWLALIAGQIDAVSLLIERDQSRQPAQLEEMLQFCIEREASITFDCVLRFMDFRGIADRGKKLLANALKRRGRRAMLDSLIAAGADINGRGDGGTTLLHDAVHIGVKRMKRLLKRGADVNAQDDEGQTPLHCAFYYMDATTILLEHGANPDARDKNGWTPLHIAAECLEEIFDLLLKGGANVNAVTLAGLTPLDVASSKSISKKLLARGGCTGAALKNGLG